MASVNIYVDRGKLRLRLPRAAFNGKQRNLALGLDDTAVNRATAKKLAALIEADIAAGLDKFDVTLTRYRPLPRADRPNNLFDAWEEYAIQRQPEIDEITWKCHYERTSRYLATIPEQLHNSPDAIARFIVGDKPGYTAKRILAQLNAAITLWNRTHAERLEQPLPIFRLSRFRDNKQPDPFTESEAKAILDGFARHQYYGYYTDFIEFLFLTGCRPGEAIALSWRNVDFRGRTILINSAYNSHERQLKNRTKNQVSRRVPCNDRLLSLLQRRSQDSALVFPAVKGGYMDAHNLTNRAWRNGVLPGLILSGEVSHYRPLKNTRHTFVSLCLSKGTPLFTVAHWVGDRVDTLSTRYAAYLGTSRVPDFL